MVFEFSHYFTSCDYLVLSRGQNIELEPNLEETLTATPS